MRSLLILCCFLFAETSLAGFWCYASAPDAAERFLKEGEDLEAAKNSARSACAEKYQGCQVLECYEKSPYSFSCVSSRYTRETRPGGYRGYGECETVAKNISYNRCYRVWGRACVTSCFPNFQPEHLVYP